MLKESCYNALKASLHYSYIKKIIFSL